MVRLFPTESPLLHSRSNFLIFQGVQELPLVHVNLRRDPGHELPGQRAHHGQHGHVLCHVLEVDLELLVRGDEHELTLVVQLCAASRHHQELLIT